MRVLRQLSEVYSCMNISSLAALIPFMSFSEVEQLVVEAVKHGYLQVHRFYNCCLAGVLVLGKSRLANTGVCATEGPLMHSPVSDSVESMSTTLIMVAPAQFRG